jgi:hypothetical protein
VRWRGRNRSLGISLGAQGCNDQTAKTQQACPSGSKHQFKCEDGACVMSQADCKPMTALANKAGPIIDSVQKGLRAV